MIQNMLILFSWFLFFTFSNSAVDFVELEQIEQIQNILIVNGIIYVGATDKILKLDSGFRTIGTYETGPHYDDSSCIEFSSIDCTDESGKKYFETKRNENQLLLLLSTNSLGDSLMACGNSQLGQCDFLNATSLTKFKLLLNPPVLQLASREIGGTFVGQVMTLGNSKVLVSARTLDKLQGDMRDIIRVLSLEKYYFLSSYKNTKKRAYSLSYDKNKVSKDIEHQYKFISIMQFNDYTYFFSVYQNITGSTTKVIRMTITENDFGFYIEKPLQCYKNGKDFKILKSISVVKLTDQAAKILKSTTDQYVVFGLFKTVASDFAVCYFDVSEIQNSIEKSLSAEKSPKAFWFTQSDDTLCLSSENVIKGTLLYESNGVHHHTVVAFPHERGITVFLSSKSSSVYEFAVDEGTLYKYAEVHFPINDQQIFTNVVVYEDNLYFSGNRFVARMLIKNCTRRTTCLSCLSGSSCGWCTLEKRCTLRSECPNNMEPMRFINEANDTCPSVIIIFPSVIEITSKVDIICWVLGVPVDVTYKCSFNELITPLKRHDTIFTCTSMDLETIPNLKIEDGVGIVNLSIVAEDTLKSVVDTTLNVYICSFFKMCTKCITSANSCGWCVKDMRCVDKAENCLQKDEWLPHIGSGASDVKCPLINNIENSLYSNGSKNDISLTGKYLLKPEDGINYQCYFKMISEKNIISSARWISETKIICDSTELFYQEAVSFKTADLSVFMGESAIDVERVAVEIFKCSFDETDCTTCKSNPKKWNCVWCKIKQTCVTTDACDSIPTVESCPAPVISKLDPMKAPIRGRTTLSIFGKDLGSTFSDIISVRVAGVQCSLRKDLYQFSKKVVCELNGPDVQDEGDVIVEVNSTTLHRTEWDSKFYFKEPLVNKGSPEVGPCSGETIISIEGKDLDIGNNAVVKVAGVSCSKVTRSKTIINCTTTPGCLQLTKEVNSGKLSGTKRKKREVTSTASVSIEIDGFKLKVPDHVKFEYKMDPLVTMIYTYKQSFIVETFASGGQVLTVEGQRLNIIKRPQMTFYLYSHDLTTKTDCRFVTKTEQSRMICLAPNISSAFDSSVKSITVMLGFVLDGVVNVKSFKNITVFADPVFNSFTDILEMKTSTLILSGAGFHVLSKKDLSVSVGESECRVTDLGENLVCKLPSELELKEKNAGLINYPVVVYVGEKGTGLMFNVGFITFYKADNFKAGSAFSATYTIIASLVSVLVVLIIIIIIFVARNHRKKEIWNQDHYRYENYEDYYKSAPDEWEISPESLVFDTKIGEGAFGNVFLSKINAKVLSKTMFAEHDFVSHDDNNDLIVAVKLLKDGANQSEFCDFREEIDLMKGIGYHKYIVNMIGCSRVKRPLCLVLEYMENGDLLQFLRIRRTKLTETTESFMFNENENHLETTNLVQNESPLSKVITPNDLMRFAWEISLGMEYLSSINLIHRDLAARNILVSAAQNLKISDFGLTRKVNEKFIYVSSRSRRLPIKWMAVEALFDHNFTPYSDVWAYGIVLFEIVTLGGSPYPTISNRELLQLLKSGYRMDQPENCSRPMYDIMLHCWNEDPLQRPTFTDLRKVFEEIISRDEKCLCFEIDEGNAYYNVPSFDSISSETSDILEEELSKDSFLETPI